LTCQQILLHLKILVRDRSLVLKRLCLAMFGGAAKCVLTQKPAATIDASIMPLFATIVVVDNVVVEDSSTGGKSGGGAVGALL
jgi:hypothetical protein